MTVWVLVMFVSAFGEYAVPGIISEDECRALYVRIQRPKMNGYEPDPRRAYCYPYAVPAK